MRVWVTTFVVLFAIAELFQWLQKFTLPLPMYILGGALLAIASNYQSKPTNCNTDNSSENAARNPAL